MTELQAKKLKKLGITSTIDLLLYLPNKYNDQTVIQTINDSLVGEKSQIEVNINNLEVKYRPKKNLILYVSDVTGQMQIRFLHYYPSQIKQLESAGLIRFYGEVRQQSNYKEMIHPEYRFINSKKELKGDETLTPIYSTIDGIQTGRLKNLIRQALNVMKTSKPQELFPKKILNDLKLPNLKNALINLHQPPPQTDWSNTEDTLVKCRERLSFEELLANYIRLRKLKLLARNTTATALKDGNNKVIDFIQSLKFNLTPAQKKAYKEILNDLDKKRPMMRMLQGDVGSGKTIVAAIACLKAISNKTQAAIMAPTELLAEQHMESFLNWFGPLKINVIKLTGGQKKTIRTEILSQIENGKIDLIIGTHALFQDGVVFKNLSLIVIDEQHRFGVNQRVALRKKGEALKKQPHQLIMTATPIPRTLAMAAYADLDSSIIDKLPVGRKSIETIVIPNDKRKSVIDRVKNACINGEQAYWVCPLIEESETIKADAATDRYDHLKDILKPLSVGLIHGRQKNTEKENMMRLFKDAHIKLLVATTVIEVGVDVPNASLMIIENAERMGLSQLHQLRGRVGRGNKQSYCILLYKKPLSAIAHERLSVIRETNDGFKIAQKDMELRGPGELLGTKQTGLPQYRIADLVRDAHLLPKVQKIADNMMNNFPKETKKMVIRWSNSEHDYGKV